MAAPTLTSPRGQETKHFFSDNVFGDAKANNAMPSNGYNLPQAAQSEDSATAVVQSEEAVAAVVNGTNASSQKLYDVDAGAGYHPVNLSYNPITDEFKVCEGEAVL
jgi:hypothetical protein